MAVQCRLSTPLLGFLWYIGTHASEVSPQSVSLTQRASGVEFAKHDGNPCDDEDDGWQCHDDAVVQCSGGATISHQFCEFYQDCQESVSSASCVEDACKDKADGFYCEDDHIVHCKGLKTVNTTACAFYQECKRDVANALNAHCREDTCVGKMDGQYCEDDHVVECQGQLTVHTSACGFNQECHDQDYPTPTASCYDDCFEKVDGSHRKQTGVVSCLGGQTQTFMACPFYQVASVGAGSVVSCQEDACDSKTDGWHCHGEHLVQCADFVTVDILACANFQTCSESALVSPPQCV